MSRFRQTKAPDAPAAAISTGAVSRFVAAIREARKPLVVLIPGTDMWTAMVLLTGPDIDEVEAAAHAAMAALYPDGVPASAGLRHQVQIARRTLARACRCEDATDSPVATLEEWLQEPTDEQIAALWEIYQDLRAQRDPIGSPALTEGEMAEIDVWVKKKDETLLRSFGSATLARYLLTTADRPSTSPIPKSGTGHGSDPNTNDGSPPAPPVSPPGNPAASTSA